MHTITQPTPAGDLVVLVDTTADPVVVAAGFAEAAALAARAGLAGVWPAGALSLGDGPAIMSAATEGSVGPRSRQKVQADEELVKRLAAWAAGDLAALDPVVLRQRGTAFQEAVWSALGDIPTGQTRTYAEIADAIGRPGAVRAVGTACGRNALAPFVPCHRVVRADGSVGAYAFGTEAKMWLLGHERAHSANG